jgi:hypothetical protein
MLKSYATEEEATLDPLRKELSEIFWDHRYLDVLSKTWVEALREYPKASERIQQNEINDQYLESEEADQALVNAFEETETAVDKIYFALHKYPNLVPSTVRA